MWRYLKFRWGRRFHVWQHQVAHGWEVLVTFMQLHVFGKSRQLALVRRITIVWWGLAILLGVGLFLQVHNQLAAHQIKAGAPGGTYSEGAVGQVMAVNPILAPSGPSADLTKLVFNGLTRINNRGALEGDLADSWSISPDGKTYTFKLHKGVKWHDGQPFTARDVAFTITAIQNPDTRSPLATSWQGVRADAIDDTTVVFRLPNAYAPFLYLTTLGIIPRHLLEGVDPKQMVDTAFNHHPIGTGPFKLDAFQTDDTQFNLPANEHYFRGKPLLDAIEFNTYDSYAKLLDAYGKRRIMGVARVQPDQIGQAESYGDLQLYDLTTPDAVAVFFKTTTITDKALRQGLALATNRNSIVQDSLDGQATAISSPILPGHLGYSPAQTQPKFDRAAANAKLESAGYIMGKDGLRRKNGQEVTIKLVTQTGRYEAVAKQLAEQWRAVGIKTAITAVDQEQLQQSYIRPRNYDALLYGINTGADSDEYAYWASSRVADPGLNLSAYSNQVVDRALESGRVVADPALRAVKYKAFLTQWVADTPAIMLYTPDYIYGTNTKVGGVTMRKLVDPSDRFYGVEKWTVRQRQVDRLP